MDTSGGGSASGFIYRFGLLGFAIITNHGMPLVQRRFPRSVRRAAGLCLRVRIDPWACLDVPTFLSNLWGLPGAPADFSLFAKGHRRAWIESPTTGAIFTAFAAVRYFKNDRGETIVERGLQFFNPIARASVTVLATIAAFAMSMWALGL